jgi:7-dehydrocholesterol reductase
MKTYEHLWEHGVVEGLKAIWPMPTVVAWKIIFGFGLFEAVLQLLLPGKRFEGPISPTANVPIYKVRAVTPAVELMRILPLRQNGIIN